MPTDGTARSLALSGVPASHHDVASASLPATPPLEHRVVVGRHVGHDLEDVPNVHDPSLLVEAKDVHARVVVIARPVLVALEDDEVALLDRPLELNPLAGEIAAMRSKYSISGSATVASEGFVLAVRVADVSLHRFAGPRIVEQQVIERNRRPLVLLWRRCHVVDPHPWEPKQPAKYHA